MKAYGFRIIDGHGTFIRWFSSNGEFYGTMTPKMKQVIVAQQFLVFHQAYACAKAACLSRGIQFTTLYEQDYKKLGSPIVKFFKRLFR